MDRKTLPGLSADAFQSDLDKKALETLQKIPVFPKVMRKFYEVGADRWMYAWNMATAVRVGPDQFGTIDRIGRECAQILDMPVPEFYVTSNPFPNAFAGGVERPYVTLRSSIIDAMDDEQLYHLIGHELGHIKCGHVLYFSIGALLIPLLDMLGRRTLGLGDAVSWAIYGAFMEWSRKAEVSADRAGLLCSQQFDISATANLKLTAGAHRLSSEQSLPAFLDQCRAYSEMGALDSIGKLVMYVFNEAFLTHPLPVHRMKELEKWHASGAFDSILSGKYLKENAA